MTEKTETSVRRVSSFYLAIVLITLVLSLVALSLGLEWLSRNQTFEAESLMLIGFIGLALSAYMMLQARRRPPAAAFEMPKVITTILCQKCEFKNIRDFQLGDYVFKEAEPCPKCNEKMMIASIYRETEEKGKGRLS